VKVITSCSAQRIAQVFESRACHNELSNVFCKCLEGRACHNDPSNVFFKCLEDVIMIRATYSPSV